MNRALYLLAIGAMAVGIVFATTQPAAETILLGPRDYVPPITKETAGNISLRDPRPEEERACRLTGVHWDNGGDCNLRGAFFTCVSPRYEWSRDVHVWKFDGHVCRYDVILDDIDPPKEAAR